MSALSVDGARVSDRLLGRAWVFGDDVNTDVLHPPQYYSLDPERVRLGLFKGIDESLQEQLRPGDLVIGGRNFGCGSSRETSIRSFKLNGISAIVAASFARIFFRNAINQGLLCVCFSHPEDARRFVCGETARLDLAAAAIESAAAGPVAIEPPGPFVERIWRAGGLLGLLPTASEPR
jgi:3-isopropylmalate dehydratase small subunit